MTSPAFRDLTEQQEKLWDRMHVDHQDLVNAVRALQHKATALGVYCESVYSSCGESVAPLDEEARDIAMVKRLVDYFDFWVEAVVQERDGLRAVLDELTEGNQRGWEDPPA